MPSAGHEAERSASRGMRFAFVAAGAVSLAAIALGGVTTGVPVDDGGRPGRLRPGSNVTPAAHARRAGAATTPESQRRRGPSGRCSRRAQQSLGETPGRPDRGLRAPAARSPRSGRPGPAGLHPLTAPVVAGAAAMSPLIRPLSAAPPLS